MANWNTINQNMPEDDVKLTNTQTGTYNTKSSPYTNQTYTESPSVTQAKLSLESQLNSTPGAYQGTNSDKIVSLLNNLAVNAPANTNYQPARQEFIGNINRAASDTADNLAKLSSGYGNTFSGAVANQQRNAALPNINNINPALMQLAYASAQSEQNNAMNLLNAYNAQDAIEYGRHRDKVADNQAEVQRLTNMYLNQQQSDRANFEADRTFNQGAFEFTEAQKQSAFEDYQNRKLSQEQQDNENTLSACRQGWDNYWTAQDIDEANKQNAFNKEYNDYQLAERARAAAEAAARAAANEAAKKAEKDKEKDEVESEFVFDPFSNDPGVVAFKKEHQMYKDEFNRRAGTYSGIAYNGADNFDDYIDAELEAFKYTMPGDESGKEYKLSDKQKENLIYFYDLYTSDAF